MPRIVFFAAPQDFQPLFEGLLAEEGACLWEAYSELNRPVRRFMSGTDAVLGLGLGRDGPGSATSAQVGLCIPAVTPPPVIRRIDLDPRRFPRGSWRETCEGCGIFWLQAGGIDRGTLIASTLIAFSEHGARARCLAEPGPNAVDWGAHARTVRRLTRLIRVRLKVASAGAWPVLQGALDQYRSGMKLALRARQPALLLDAP